MKKFIIVAPNGTHVAYRKILAPDNKAVLAIHTGAYLPRLGNLRESVVYTLDGDGKEDFCIICEFGGVLRQLVKFMNDEPNEFEKLFTPEHGSWERLDEIKKRYS